MPISRRAFIRRVAALGAAATVSVSPRDVALGQPLVRRVPTEEELRAQSETLWRLVDLLNAFRARHELAAVPLSPRLTAVAAYHVRDLAVKKPHKEFGSLHAWSRSDAWTGGAFKSDDAKTHPIMWRKPAEIAGYAGNGYEISIAGARDLPHCIPIWEGSRPHCDVILNRGIWARQRWQALGAAFHEGFACAWFGAERDA